MARAEVIGFLAHVCTGPLPNPPPPQVENATNSTLTLDGASPAYKQFAAKVEVRRWSLGVYVAHACTHVQTTPRIRAGACVGTGSWRRCYGAFGRQHGPLGCDVVLIARCCPCAAAATHSLAQAIAKAHGIPAKLLVDVKKGAADEVRAVRSNAPDMSAAHFLDPGPGFVTLRE